MWKTDLLVVVLAATVGYGTNWLAVKMLFRPLHAKYVCGFRVPFTPGMVPAKKDEIVSGIADGVAKHILTTEVIERELSDIDLLAPIESYVRSVVLTLSEGDLATEKAREQVTALAATMAESEALRETLSKKISPGLVVGVGGAAAGGTWLLTALPWVNKLPRKTLSSVAAGAAALAAEKLSDEIAKRVARSAGESVQKAVEDGMVDDAVREALRRFPDALFDPGGELRGKIESGLRSSIPKAAESVDVRGVVERRLATFDVEDLEGLVLRASSQHLKAITYLGGVLGAIVGLIQVALRRLLI